MSIEPTKTPSLRDRVKDEVFDGEPANVLTALSLLIDAYDELIFLMKRNEKLGVMQSLIESRWYARVADQLPIVLGWVKITYDKNHAKDFQRKIVQTIGTELSSASLKESPSLFGSGLSIEWTDFVPTQVFVEMTRGELEAMRDRLASDAKPASDSLSSEVGDDFRDIRCLSSHATIPAKFQTPAQIEPDALPQLPEPLTENDRNILIAMFEVSAFIETPVPSDVILKRAISTGEAKRAFERLKRCDLVAAKPRHGRWLTLLGKQYAALFAEETDCAH